MFVTRAVYEDAIRQRDAALARYDALLEKYHALRLAGQAVPEPAPAPLPERERDPIADVIGVVAGSNATLRRQLVAHARRKRAEGEDETDIVHGLLNWEEDDSGVPG